MAIATDAQRKALVSAYTAAAPYGALFTSTGPGTSGAANNETVTTGAVYSRQPIVWGTPTTAGSTATSTGNAVSYGVYGGQTVTYWGCCVSGTATTADVRDAVGITSQVFASNGTYTITPTITIA